MNYKKKYEKLVDAVKVLRDNNPSDEGIQNWVNDNVPELRQNEDEMIRKEFCEDIWNSFPYEKAHKYIAWLEKQDKQKLTWSEEDEKVRKALKEAGYEWSEETHELKKIEQNPAWSEEDEKMIDEIIDYMKPMPIFFESTKGKSGKEYTQKFVKNAINWLKSLKERIGE